MNIFQKANIDTIYIVFLRPISNFKKENDIALLGINCPLKLIAIIDFGKIACEKFLTEIIITVNDTDLFLENNVKNKNKNNELLSKTIKKLLNQLVLTRKYNIFKNYQIAVNICNIQDDNFFVIIFKEIWNIINIIVILNYVYFFSFNNELIINVLLYYLNNNSLKIIIIIKLIYALVNNII